MTIREFFIVLGLAAALVLIGFVLAIYAHRNDPGFWSKDDYVDEEQE